MSHYKQSSFLLAGLGVHAAQNLGAKALIRTPAAAQAVADAVRQGFVNKAPYIAPLKHRVAAGLIGHEVAEVPQYANAAARGFSEYLDRNGHVMTKHDHLALRMLTQGRVDDLAKLKNKVGGLPILDRFQEYAHGSGNKILQHIASQGNTSEVKRLFAKPKTLREAFSPESYPLLSNISRNATRGRAQEAATPGRLHKLVEPVTAAALALAEPAAGAINYAKMGVASPVLQKHVPGLKRAADWVEHSFVDSAKNSLKSGFNTVESNKYLATLKNRAAGALDSVQNTPQFSKLKNMAKGTVVNGLAGELDRTAYALGQAGGKVLQR